MPETMSIELSDRSVFYKHPDTGADMVLKISRGTVYVLPNGYQVQLVRHPVSKQWMLIGTVQQPKFLFKPSSVSGAGKSELSKSVMDAVTSGPFFIKDWERTVREADEMINHDYGKRLKKAVDYQALGRQSRALLSFERSLGSVIQLLTVDDEQYTPEYNEWLKKFDQDSISFVFLVKAMYRPSWGDHNSWKAMFRLDKVNGKDGYSLKCQDLEVVCNYLRVGQEKNEDGWYWRNFRLRQDFYAAAKFQNNDDIGCSLVCSGRHLANMSKNQHFNVNRSYKLTTNCEYRYFQRPDDACHPGIDKKCEEDLGRLEGKTFISNFEPVTKEFCQNLADDVMTLEKYSEPMQRVVKRFAAGEFAQYDHVVVSSEFRIINQATGARSKNVRYLQTRDELLYQETKQDKYLMEIRARLNKRIPFSDPVILPVDCYVPGRRLNTVDKKNPNIRPLSIYGPIHWQPVPLLMLEWITCLSGKSPSTNGSGSLEGCLSKGPFNNMLMSIDLNYACLALILGTEPVLSTAAGSVGHKLKVDHDITLILPELICRMTPEELDPQFLIKEGSLELVDDMVVDGQKVHSSILGYRITQKFVKKYFARIFDHVEGLFTDEFLRPERQSMENFVNGVDFIYTNMKEQVDQYCRDGSYEELIPPLQVLFEIVKHDGEYKGMTLTSPEFLRMFDREEVVKTDWYKARLIQGQRNEIRTCEREIAEMRARGLPTTSVEERLGYVRSQLYLDDIFGSLGAHVFADAE